jgi:hypothetical protein
MMTKEYVTALVQKQHFTRHCTLTDLGGRFDHTTESQFAGSQSQSTDSVTVWGVDMTGMIALSDAAG